MTQSDKHSARIDEELFRNEQSFLRGAPVDSRLQEQRRDEGIGPRPGQPSADAQPLARQPVALEDLDALEVAQRSEMASYLDGSIFPARKGALLADAQSHNAPEHVINLIEHLPKRTKFGHMQSVWNAASDKQRLGRF